tara:strand:- start:632 stop:841 length:210 start_codon:yes stop_codon:yes gene_type:complete
MYSTSGYEKQVDNKTKNKRKHIKKILNEYKIKMNSFHPKDTSPNHFVNKLEYRMNQYYNLYKSKNILTK